MKRFLLAIPLLIFALFATAPDLAAQVASVMLPTDSPRVTYAARYEGDALIIEVDHDPHWHTYDFNNVGMSTSTEITVSGGLEAIGEWSATPAAANINVDENGQAIEGSSPEFGWGGHVEFRLKVKRVAGNAAFINITGQVCDENVCLMFDPMSGGVLSLTLPEIKTPVEAEAEKDAGVEEKATLETTTTEEVAKPETIDVSKLSNSAVVKGGGDLPDELVRYTAEVKGDKLVITVKHAPHWHTYDFNNKERKGDSLNTEVHVSGGLKLIEKLTASVESVNQYADNPEFGMTDWVWSDVVEFSAKVIRVSEDPTLVRIRGMVCENQCVFYNEIDTELKISVANERSILLASKKEIKEAAAMAPSDEFSGEGDINELSWLAFIGMCIGGGLLALIMPCVFPMIPITVSFFSKQAASTEKSTIGIAFVYGLGLIVSYTGLGAILSTFWTVSDFGNNYYVAIAIGLFFLVFAMSMFGLFELRLPHGLAQKFNMQGKANGALGAFLLGLTFAVTSMACTVPVIGSIFAAASSGDWTRPIVGMVIYSSIVATPFVILGAMPGLVQKMPKAGGWMNNVKVVFGFVELAAAAEFFGWARLIDREMVLAIWIATSIGAALYLLGIYRTKHDMENAGIGPLRIIFATMFMVIVFWLFPSLDGTPLRSDFIESFLRAGPDRKVARAGAEVEENLWVKNPDLKAALIEAKAAARPVFIDITDFN